MKEFQIRRFLDNGYATYGVLLRKSESPEQYKPVCCTLENPWKHNQINISCIPPGSYKAEIITEPYSKHFGMYRLKRVPGRSLIDIHVGNYPKNTLGCPLLGMGIGPAGISQSGDAVASFLRMCRNRPIIVEVVNYTGVTYD